MTLRLIPANEYRRERWRNGLGWTREIVRGSFRQAAVASRADATAEPPHDDWDWRLSIAEVDHACTFSAFPSCDRVLMLLSGNGMRLAFDDGSTAEVVPQHGRVAFRGELGVACELIDGATTDFNAIVRRDRCTMQVYLRPLVGSMVFFAETGVVWAIHLIAGRATVKSGADKEGLDAGDTALLDNADGGAAARSILDGGGDVVLVRIQRND